MEAATRGTAPAAQARQPMGRAATASTCRVAGARLSFFDRRHDRGFLFVLGLDGYPRERPGVAHVPLRQQRRLAVPDRRGYESDGRRGPGEAADEGRPRHKPLVPPSAGVAVLGRPLEAVEQTTVARPARRAGGRRECRTRHIQTLLSTSRPSSRRLVRSRGRTGVCAGGAHYQRIALLYRSPTSSEAGDATWGREREGRAGRRLEPRVDLVELKEKTTLSREEAASRLRAIADELASGNDIVMERDHLRFVARVPDEVRLKIEFEVEEDGSEFEIELTW